MAIHSRYPRSIAGIILWLFLASNEGVAAALHFEHLGPEDGLSHNTANALIQDRHGFIWIATDDGLNRYDGYGFRHFRLEPAPGASNVFMKLLEDEEGILWIGARGGLLRFDPRAEHFEWVELGAVPEDRKLEITALALDADQRLWVAQGNRLFAAETTGLGFSKVLEVSSAGNHLAQVILEIEFDSEGHVWLLIGGPAYLTTRIARISGGNTLEEFPLGDNEAPGRAFHFDREGGLWLSANQGRRALPQARMRPDGLPPSAGIHAVTEAADGTVWLGTTGDGLFRIPPDGSGEAQPHRPGHSWQDRFVLDLLIDRAGSLWVGTLGGLWRHDPGRRPFLHLGVADDLTKGLGVGAVSSLAQGADSTIWVGTFGGGLYRWQPETGSVTPYRHDPENSGSLCDDTIWALHVDGSGGLWVGGATAICRMEPATRTFKEQAMPRAWNRPLDMRVLGGGADASILSGFSVLGLWALDTHTDEWQPLIEIDGQLQSLEVIGGSDAWLGYHTGFLVRVDLESGQWRKFELADANGARYSDMSIYDIHADSPDSLWLATDNGLGRFHADTGTFEFPIAAETLPGSVCYSVEPDASGALWIGTNRGLARLDPTGPAETVWLFDLTDGLGNIEFNRHAAFRSSGGRMFFGGMTGVTAFRPEQVRPNPVAPPVALTRVSVLGSDGERDLIPHNQDRLTLNPDDRAVAFEFAALNYIVPERNRYAYRMDGLDAEWVAAGHRRFVRYAGLAPGDYVFRVRGSNNHGVWSEQEARLPIRVLPAFWQTWWFRGVVVAVLLGMIYLAHRARIRRLLELDKVRLRIASDLHDELSGELSSIALSSAIARRQDYLEDPERRRLEEIESTSRQVIDGLRDLVWTINPEHDSLDATVRRMRGTASRLLNDHDLSFEENWTSGRGGVAMTVRRDLHLILKEALTNIMRHARANRVVVRLERMDDRLRLDIVDDGSGFDPAAIGDGTGLASMRRRAGRLGARLDIEPMPERGTRVRLDLPLRRIRKDGESS